ncbi:OmpH family outer membrane protein [candidate division KSB1 bacterium]|nr:OmpH family outer membrane protein [candidate division KSB1 bacterium]
MKRVKWFFMLFLALALMATGAFAQKMAYINSQKIIATYKEAQDAQERLNKISEAWEEEGRAMQRQFQELGEQLESQSLLLSDERRREKQAELQNLYMRIQQFQNEKWGQNGELYKKQEEVMQPIFDKINAAIKKVAEEENYDYVFDTVNGNIVYASPKQTDLTDLVLQELEKGLPAKTSPTSPR